MIKVALENSDSRRVELSRVNLDTSGTYMCEVVSSIITIVLITNRLAKFLFDGDGVM